MMASPTDISRWLWSQKAFVGKLVEVQTEARIASIGGASQCRLSRNIGRSASGELVITNF